MRIGKQKKIKYSSVLAMGTGSHTEKDPSGAAFTRGS